MTSIQEKVNSITEKYDLLQHPFYQAWSDGTLPAEKLGLYSEEYGTFIRQVADLWEAAGDSDIAEEEREHAQIWSGFAASMGRQIADKAKIEQILALNETMAEACEDRVQAIGALLAFEIQQPKTVESKLKGLKENYSNLNVDEKYFEIHLDDWDEPEMLVAMIEKMDAADQQKCLDSLENACQRLWDGLTGVHEA